MANNCLITKLKAQVDNPSLIKLSDLIIEVLQPSVLEANPSLVTIQNNSSYSFINNYSAIKITNKDTLDFNLLNYSKDELLKIDLLKLSTCKYLHTLIICSTSGDNIIGDTKYLPQSIQYLYMPNKEVELKDLGHLINLKEIRAIMDQYKPWSRLFGTIEDFVNVQIQNGRTVCTGLNIGLPYYQIPTGITYQGTSLGVGKKLSWNWDGTSANISLTDL